MLVRLADLDMTANGRVRWGEAPPEDRDILQVCFEDAIERPERVGDYHVRDVVLPCGSRFLSHRIRFGYANYCFYVFDRRVFVHDLGLDPMPG